MFTYHKHRNPHLISNQLGFMHDQSSFNYSDFVVDLDEELKAVEENFQMLNKVKSDIDTLRYLNIDSPSENSSENPSELLEREEKSYEPSDVHC